MKNKILKTIVLSLITIHINPGLANTPIVINNDNQLSKIIEKTNMPIVIDFYAEWCNACKFMAPVLDRLSDKYKDQVRFIKVDIDQAKQTSSAYKINGVPSIVFIDKNRKIKKSITGINDLRILEHYIREIIE